MTWTLYQGDALQMLRQLEPESVHCCVTSPPYYNLRDYGVDGQLGLESTPEEYVAKMVEVFGEVRRVLRRDGTLWLNIGDCYSGSRKGGATHPENAGHYKQGSNRGLIGQSAVTHAGWGDCKHKNLLGIPWRVTFALQADGWYLRSDIIWSKPNPMPESVRDRPTKSHEYVFLLSKSARYYYDAEAIKEPCVYNGFNTGVGFGYGSDAEYRERGRIRESKKRGEFGGKTANFKGREAFRAIKDMRNKRTVWTVPTTAFPEAHFATFPPEIPEICIKAGCPGGGMVLDPFVGSGTTLWVAEQLGRNSIGIEIKPEYCDMTRRRMAGLEPSLFEGVTV